MNDSSIRNTRRDFLGRWAAVAAIAAVARSGSCRAAEGATGGRQFDVREFGAKGDGQTLDTAALQRAIEACAGHGGGTVHFPAGRYLSGTLVLKSWVTLELDAGATLLGSTRLEDYPPTVSSIRSFTDTYTERSLIYGEHLQRVTLQGRGTIDGQGGAFKGPYHVRPYLVRMAGCREVLVRNLTLRDSPMWVQHYLACDDVRIEGVTVASKCNANNDGIDINGCRRVRIAQCDIQSGDDAIVLKSTLERACEQVTVSNCTLNSDCNAFKLGTESNGGFRNILLSNCAIYDTRLAGIALETLDGGVLDGVSISNVAMENVRCPIFVRLGNRARPFQAGMPRPAPGALRNVSLSDIQASGADRIGCCIAGMPGRSIQNLMLRNIRIAFAGGGTEADAQRQIPKKAEAYPEYSMFGVLPAYGFYCRHALNVRFHDVEVSAAAADARPSLMCDDVDGLRVMAWRAPAAGVGPVLRLEDVRDGLVQGCIAASGTAAYLRVGGARSADIRLLANDLRKARKDVEVGPEVPPGTVEHKG